MRPLAALAVIETGSAGDERRKFMSDCLRS